MSKHWVAEFHQQGYAVIPGVISATEMSEISDEAIRIWEKQEALIPQNLRVGLRQDINGEVVLERLDPVIDISRLFSDLVKDNRLLEITEAVLQSPVLPLKEKLIYKWPGCSGYGLHRDEPYFGISGVPGDEMLSVYVAIDPASELNGAIRFFPTLRYEETTAPEGEPRDVALGCIEGIPPVIPELSPGDVVLFDGLIPHYSELNESDMSRRMFTVTYAPEKYQGCRERYYEMRFREQSEIRAKTFPGPFFLK